MSTENLLKCDAIVVGAGVAGLVAADALTRAGKTVMVFEARDRVGGRAYSLPTQRGAVDLGATWHWEGERLIQSLVRELDIKTFPQYLHGDALFDSDASGVQRLQGNPIDAPAARLALGAQELAQQLAGRLICGTLRLSEPVSAITLTNRGIRVDASSLSLIAEHVIIAVPPPLAAEHITFMPALPDVVRTTAESIAVWMGDTVKAVAMFDEPFWRATGLSGSAISYRGPFREFHDHSGSNGTPAALFAFATATQFIGMESSAIEDAFQQQLKRMFGPTAPTPTEVHITDWSKEPFTTPNNPLPTTSTIHFGAAALQRPVHERIHWASTETATAYAGHLEGAIHAGQRAAQHALNP